VEEVKTDEKLTAILRSLQQIAFVTCITQKSIDAVVKEMIECQEQMETLQDDVQQLNGGPFGDEAPNDRGPMQYPVPTRHPNVAELAKSPVFIGFNSTLKGASKVSNLQINKVKIPTGAEILDITDQRSPPIARDITGLEDIRGLNARVDAMQSRLITSIQHCKTEREKKKVSLFTDGVLPTTRWL